jgi:hypothetical protein
MGQYMKLNPAQKVNAAGEGDPNSEAKAVAVKRVISPPARDRVRISPKGKALANQTGNASQASEAGSADQTSETQSANTQNVNVQNANTQNATAASTADSVQISQKVQTFASQAVGVDQIRNASQANGVSANNSQKFNSYQASAGTNSAQTESSQPTNQLPLNVYA